jgi:peptidoglycan/LPS O-acetylase OafA/YrhL
MAELPPKPANTRYLALDLWRGMACLMLVVYHATFYTDYQFQLDKPETWTWSGLPLNLASKAWIGVQMFFVISGYCIAASLDSLRRKPRSLTDYFLRRFRRIYPPLWIVCGLAIGFVMLVSLFPLVTSQCAQLPKLSEFSLWNWLGNFLAAESWLHHVSGRPQHFLMPNTWTLCYEEQFYLVAGIILATAPRHMFGITALITLVVFLVRIAARQFHLDCSGFFWDGHWLMFAVGIFLYQALHYLRGARQWLLLAGLGLGMVYAAFERFTLSDPGHRHLAEYLFIACGFAIALFFLYRWDTRVAKHRWLAPFRWAGQRSYSIYLTHFLPVVVISSLLAYFGVRSEPMVILITVPASILMSLPLACLFYHLVERRFLNPPLAEREAKQGGRQFLASEPKAAPLSVITDGFALYPGGNTKSAAST